MSYYEISFPQPESDAILTFANPELFASSLLRVAKLNVSKVSDNWRSGNRVGQIDGVVDLIGEQHRVNASVYFPGRLKTFISNLLQHEPSVSVNITIE